MSKIDDAKKILSTLNMPTAQQSDIACYTLLALSSVTEKSSWSKATNEWLRIYDIMQFASTSYGKTYAPNTRETFRKQALHHYRNAAMIEDNGLATNSPNYSYKLTDEFLDLIKTFRTEKWNDSIKAYFDNHPSLVELYSSKKKMTKMPVIVNNAEMLFSTGKHNLLQKKILEDFAPRFAPFSECLYVGDTIEKDLFKNEGKLRNLGFVITLHDKMPDVVLYREDKDWLYFIEAVTSVGPMDSKRILEISKMSEKVTAGKVFVTAFLDFKTFKRFSESLAWETEVWIADLPEHMIHMDGDRFLGPR
jgi:hypothetical protein